MVLTTEAFQNFLRSNQQTLIFQEDSRTKSLVKVTIYPRTSRFYSIYLNSFLEEETCLSFRQRDNLGDSIGIYDSVTDTFFTQAEFLMEWHMKSVDTTVFQALCEVSQQLEKELAEQTLAEINQHYKYYYTLERAYLANLSDWKITSLKKEVRKKLLDGETAFMLDRSFIKFDCSDSELLDLLMDKQSAQSRLVKEYLSENENKVSKHLQDLQFQQQYAKALADTPAFQKEKKIVQAVQNKGMKTLTVTYQIFDEELTFKMDNVINSERESFYSSVIVNKKEREAYNHLTREAIHLQNIKQIRYGRNVLYSELD